MGLSISNKHIAFTLQHFAQYHQCDQFCNLARYIEHGLNMRKKTQYISWLMTL
jgi:hypothetical protein